MDRKYRPGWSEEWGESKDLGDSDLADPFEGEYLVEGEEPAIRRSDSRLRQSRTDNRFSAVQTEHRRLKAMKRRRDARRARERGVY